MSDNADFWVTTSIGLRCFATLRKLTVFPDGELLVKFEADVRGRDVFIIQPTCSPVNRSLMELLIFIDCARRASAKRITAVIPYFGYARQDRKDEGRVPITAKLVANLIATAGADRVLTLDLHAAQVQGFFDIPVDNLHAEPVLSKYFAGLGLENLVLVSPDPGNAKRASKIPAGGAGGRAHSPSSRSNPSAAPSAAPQPNWRAGPGPYPAGRTLKGSSQVAWAVSKATQPPFGVDLNASISIVIVPASCISTQKPRPGSNWSAW